MTEDTTAAPEADDTAEPVAYFYLGRRQIKGGKVVHALRRKDVADGTISFWPKVSPKRYATCEIGRLYLIGKSLPTYWPSAAVPDVKHPDALEWEVEDRDAELQTRKVEHSPRLTAILADLRAARLRLAATRRVAFDAWLLEQIR